LPGASLDPPPVTLMLGPMSVEVILHPEHRRLKMADDIDISPASIRALIEELAKPIDFETLESQGLIRKEGAWYRLIKPNELPEHVSRKISTIKTDDTDVFAKFESKKPYQKLKERLK
jgi:hypothetical protein